MIRRGYGNDAKADLLFCVTRATCWQECVRRSIFSWDCRDASRPLMAGHQITGRENVLDLDQLSLKLDAEIRAWLMLMVSFGICFCRKAMQRCKPASGSFHVGIPLAAGHSSELMATTAAAQSSPCGRFEKSSPANGRSTQEPVRGRLRDERPHESSVNPCSPRRERTANEPGKNEIRQLK